MITDMMYVPDVRTVNLTFAVFALAGSPEPTSVTAVI